MVCSSIRLLHYTLSALITPCCTQPLVMLFSCSDASREHLK